MCRLLKTEAGFSMVEVVIAAVIFALAAAGIFATITALTKPAEDSSHDVTAALVGKQVLEDLRRSVDGDTWTAPGGNLAVGTHGPTNQTIGGVTYTVTYTVTADPNTAGRQVTLTVTW